MEVLTLALRAVGERANEDTLALLTEKLHREDRPYIIAVDFDGTLCENRWPEIGPENSELIAAVSLLREMGALIILWTCREEDDLEAALEWCRQRGLSFDAVNENCACIIELFEWNTRKVHADEYWDDRAVRICWKGNE